MILLAPPVLPKLYPFPMIKDTLLLKVSEILDGNQGKKKSVRWILIKIHRNVRKHFKK